MSNEPEKLNDFITKNMIRRTKSLENLRLNINSNKMNFNCDFHSVYDKRSEVRRKREFKKYLHKEYGRDLNSQFFFPEKRPVTFHLKLADADKVSEFLDLKFLRDMYFPKNNWMELEDMIVYKMLIYWRFNGNKNSLDRIGTFYENDKKEKIKNNLAFRREIKHKIFFDEA